MQSGNSTGTAMSLVRKTKDLPQELFDQIEGDARSSWILTCTIASIIGAGIVLTCTIRYKEAPEGTAPNFQHTDHRNQGSMFQRHIRRPNVIDIEDVVQQTLEGISEDSDIVKFYERHRSPDEQIVEFVFRSTVTLTIDDKMFPYLDDPDSNMGSESLSRALPKFTGLESLTMSVSIMGIQKCLQRPDAGLPERLPIKADVLAILQLPAFAKLEVKSSMKHGLHIYWYDNTSGQFERWTETITTALSCRLAHKMSLDDASEQASLV